MLAPQIAAVGATLKPVGDRLRFGCRKVRSVLGTVAFAKPTGKSNKLPQANGMRIPIGWLYARVPDLLN